MPDLAGDGRVLKRFRVAREGQTVDGRLLSRQEIQQMAASYNTENYGARVNVEHISGFSPEPPFNAYGDVVLVDAVEENGQLSLYNTISALPNLLNLNKAGQKIYPSIEFYRDFAGSGKAYQVGLGLTDTPASLGTESLKFSSNPKLLKTLPDTEIVMSASQVPAIPATSAEQKTLLSQLIDALTPKPKIATAVPTTEDYNATVFQGLMVALNGITELKQQLADLNKSNQPAPVAQPAAPIAVEVAIPLAVPQANPESTLPDTSGDQLTELNRKLTELQQQFNQALQTSGNTPPPVSGGDADQIQY